MIPFCFCADRLHFAIADIFSASHNQKQIFITACDGLSRKKNIGELKNGYVFNRLCIGAMN